jgi:hypothetical protein
MLVVRLSNWGCGGATGLGNLVLLCYRHHWMIHEGGWQLAWVERRQLLTIPPARTHRSWIRAPTDKPWVSSLYARAGPSE